MSDAQAQVARVLSESEVPADMTREDPLVPDPHADRTRKFAYTNFSRMNTRWPGADQARLEDIQYQADQLVRGQFKMAFDLIAQVYRIVREPQRDPATGKVRLAIDETPLWVTDEFNNPVEDWSQLDADHRARFLLAITMHLLEWEQTSANTWAEAMYAKVVYEEKFAAGFLSLPGMQVSGKPTIDDRTQSGHRFSANDRYFAVFKSAVSRKADAVVRSMTRISRLLETTAER